MPEPLPADRRASQRVPVDLWTEEISDDQNVFRRAANLSRGGLYLEQTTPIPVGSSVRLRFTLPGDAAAIEVAGVVVAVEAARALGLGVKFTEISAPAQERLDHFLTRALTPVELPVL